MTLAWKAGNMIMGLSSDTKPTTNLPTDFTFYETDTGNNFIWNGTTWATINRAPVYSYISKVNTDSPYTIAAGDHTIGVDASSGAVTLTLPTAVGRTGKTYSIRRTDTAEKANLVTVSTTSSQTIGTAPAWYLSIGEFLTVESDGSNWQVLNCSQPSSIGYYNPPSGLGRRRVAGASDWASLGTSSTSPATGTLWAMPLLVARVTKFTQIAFSVTTGAATNARAGIYRDNGQSYPGALMFDSGNQDCSTATVKAQPITTDIQIFPPGLYWLAWEVQAATIQIRRLPDQPGIIDVFNYSLTQTIPPYGYSVAHTYGSLPDPYTAGGTVLTNAPTNALPVPAVALFAQ